MQSSRNYLERFVVAQASDFPIALREIRAGLKCSHWIWYIFPQLRQLGRSDTAREFGLDGLQEASDYLAHPILGPRLVECVDAMLHHSNRSAVQILGEIDAMKFRSCLTLFAKTASEEPCFANALKQFFPEGPDMETLRLLADSS